ncbi:MAG: hypothetical protein KJ888_20910 [Gammaproteobacteria bacterium]|nr:hypothetical protein [Gammaproteobacteria bacterium]MBU2346659.1 hypothetical protein [Gammaproteobacteria bacterium]
MKLKLNKKFFPAQELVKLVAIDPGKSTGVAVATLLREREAGSAVIWDVLLSTTTLYPWPDIAVASALAFDVLDSADAVICEEWRLRQDKATTLIGQQLTGPEVKGAVQLWCLSHRIPIHLRTASQITGTQNHVKSKVEDWPVSDHEQDALCHLVMWIEENLSIKKRLS